jgi:N-acetylglucosamine-6-phosphate deacetylase
MSGGRELRGRIPGRNGLWSLVHDGTRIQSLACVQPRYEETRCPWITPGLFDLQINGIAGVDFTSRATTVDDLARADALLASKGVIRYCPTFITCGIDEALASLATFRTAWAQGRIPGAWAIHLEGPWISPQEGYRGVHPLRHIRPGSGEELDRMIEASGNRIRLLTVAPEVDGAERLIAHAEAAGIVVSLGHTAATAAEVAGAIRAGARMSTHLFNGCARLVDRHANPIFAQLAADELFACFIADSNHIPLSTLKIGLRAKGIEKSVLVSDIVPLSGMPEGVYEMGDNPVELRDGGLFVKGSWMLSGAVRTLDEDVEILCRQSEPGIENALLMATRNPAIAMKDPGWAELVPGRGGPVVVFTWDGTRLGKQVVGD